MNHAYRCECCKKTYRKEETVPGIEGTILGALTGLAIGASTKNAPVALLFCIAGAMVGRAVDEDIAPRCPQCAQALKIVARSFLSAQGLAAPMKLLGLATAFGASAGTGEASRDRPTALGLPRF